MKEKRNKQDKDLPLRGSGQEHLRAKEAISNEARIAPEAMTVFEVALAEDELQRLRLRLNNDIVGGRTSRVKIALAAHPWLARTRLDSNGVRHGYIQRGYTPLHLAAAVGRSIILQILLEAGADATVRNDDGHLPLFYAVTAPVRPYHARSMGLQLLLNMETRIEEERELEIALADTMIALAGAGEVGGQGLITLWSMGVDLDARDATGRTAVHTSVVYQDIDCYELLTELHAAAHPVDDAGDTPLHLAVRQNSLPLVETLLRHEGDEQQRNRVGKSAHDLAKKSELFNLIELFDSSEEVQNIPSS